MSVYRRLREIRLFNVNGPSNFIIILITILCLIVLAVFSLRVSFNDSSIPIGINHIEGAIKIDFQLDDLKKADAAANKTIDLGGLNTEGVKLKGLSQLQGMEMYNVQMLKDGWSFTYNDNWYYYRKGTKGVAIAAVKEDDINALNYIEKISPQLRKQLEVGDVLVTFVIGPYEKVRLLGA